MLAWVKAVIKTRRSHIALNDGDTHHLLVFTDGRCDDRLRQHIFAPALWQLVALRAAWLIHQPARTPLAQALFLSMVQLHNPDAQGLEVPGGNILQNQLLKTQFTDQPLQLSVLRLQLLQPPRLVHLQAANSFRQR